MCCGTRYILGLGGNNIGTEYGVRSTQNNLGSINFKYFDINWRLHIFYLLE